MGLHYALSQVGVTAAVPGCKNVEELQADLAYYDADDREKDFSEILSDIRQFSAGECVYCNHCLPCPQEINIGATIRVWEAAAGTADEKSITDYKNLPTPASECIECGDCEDRCPFGVEVIPKMNSAAALFE
jgi:uncharacterized protein